MNDDVDVYLAKQTGEARERLETLRNVVRELCPRAVESISYGLIAFKLNDNPLVYFGGFTTHIGLYATPAGHEEFAAEFARYVQGKGSVQLPLSEPLPVDLVRRVVARRIETVSEKLPKIGSPATRALAEIGVTGVSQLAAYSESELLALHGVGPKAIRVLREAGVAFRTK